jgi:hypothetical protein
MVKENSIILCYSPSISSKYWKSLFNPLKDIFQSRLIFVNKSTKEKDLTSWGRTNYPNSKIVCFLDRSFRMKDQAFSGYASENVALVKIQPELKVPLNCRSSKLIKVPWYNATLVAAIHEISHLFGLSHCSTPKCVMAKYTCNRNSGFCWPCVARRSKFYRSKIFCDKCYAKLRSSEIPASN